MKKKYTITLLAFIVLAIALSIYYLQYYKQTKNDIVAVGSIIFLTGPVSDLGQQEQRGIIVGMEEINETGGINGKKLQIIFEDSQNTAKEAVNAYNRLVAKRVEVITATGDIEFSAINDLAEREKIPTIGTLSTGGTMMTNRSRWLFRFLYSEKNQARDMADFAFNNLGIKSAAILHVNSSWGEEAKDQFVKFFEALKGKITGIYSFDMDQIDLRGQISKLKNNNPQGVYLKGWGSGYISAIRQLREQKYTGYILSDAVMGTPNTIKQSSPANENAYFTNAHFNPKSKDPTVVNFVQRYKKKYEGEPSVWSAFSYDCLMFIKIAIEKGGNDNNEIRYQLLSIKNYNGASGELSFDSQGELVYDMAIMKIENGEVVRVK